ncbi:MAG: hypothetical protein J5685_03960 [Clostridiales bacterium]|nr:hypothetical protein [Clostridiales bacterium]
MTSLLSSLADKDTWEEFWSHKASGICQPAAKAELRTFIDSAGYMEVCKEIADLLENGTPFPLPRKSVISKMSTQKKRTVYIYPRAETVTLKLLTYLILRKYDHIFSGNLYSFRPDTGARNAIDDLRTAGNLYSYKVDISNYFNSIDIDRLAPMLDEILSDDPLLLKFLLKLLSEPGVLSGGKEITEDKGIMAGTPIACFYANIFLRDLDEHFMREGVIYARYSDDIIVFAETSEEIEEYERYIKEYLASLGLSVNEKKEERTVPGQRWTFLGFSCDGTTVDIAPATVQKLKKKMRRKARSLMRWASRNDVPPENAAKAFIRIFNRKLLDTSDDRDLTWSYWFFPAINTDESLRIIDSYAQDTIRYIASGTRTKARYNIRYEDMKRWGYKSLLAEYYSFGKNGDC